MPVVLAEADAIEGHFDDESQYMAEKSREPNSIVPLDAFDCTSVKMSFTTVAAVYETVEAATRSIDLMPGNEKYQTERDFQAFRSLALT